MRETFIIRSPQIVSNHALTFGPFPLHRSKFFKANEEYFPVIVEDQGSPLTLQYVGIHQPS